MKRRRILSFILAVVTAMAVVTAATPSYADAADGRQQTTTQSSNPTWE